MAFIPEWLQGVIDTMQKRANEKYEDDLNVYRQASQDWITANVINRDNGLPIARFTRPAPARVFGPTKTAPWHRRANLIRRIKAPEPPPPPPKQPPPPPPNDRPQCGCGEPGGNGANLWSSWRRRTRPWHALPPKVGA